MSKYPKTIYVQKEKDSDGSTYLLADEELENRDDGEIAIYQLVETKKKITSFELV